MTCRGITWLAASTGEQVTDDKADVHRYAMTARASVLPRGCSVWAYLRASGPEQQERGTIVSQRESMENWAQDKGLVITRWFVDEAKPGSDVVKRDDFNEMVYLTHRVDPKAPAIVRFPCTT